MNREVEQSFGFIAMRIWPTDIIPIWVFML
jgi:hypothetical protein